MPGRCYGEKIKPFKQDAIIFFILSILFFSKKTWKYLKSRGRSIILPSIASTVPSTGEELVQSDSGEKHHEVLIALPPK